MKKITALCLCLLISLLCLSGCHFFETDRSIAYTTFARKHHPGMTKQEIVYDIGAPEAYTDAHNQYHKVDYSDREVFEVFVDEDTSVKWFYRFDYNTMTITFDSEGKSMSVDIKTDPVT